MADELTVIEAKDRQYASILRGVICGGGLLGVFLCARKTRLFARYEAVSEIPYEVYRKGIGLKGIVRAVHSNGYLKVEHRPTLTLPSIISRPKYIQTGLLDVRFAGIDVSDAGSEYLAKDLRLRSKMILFNAIRPVDNNKCVDAEIFYKKNRFMQTNLNVDLVRRGLARLISVTNPEHMSALKTNASYSRLISKLIISEKIADRRGLGLWTRNTWAETISSYPATCKQIILSSAITRILMSLIVVLKELAIKGRNISEEVAKFIFVLCCKVYPLLQRFVDALSKLSGIAKKKIEKFSSK